MSVALAQARLRVFAGPNGSGKSTIRDELRDEWIGVYVNADEIESALKQPAGLNLDAFDLMLGEAELTVQLMAFFRSSVLLKSADLTSVAEALRVIGSTLYLPRDAVNSYVASALADFIRRRLMTQGTSFTFETVMSSPDKVLFLNEARQEGFRTYLYFVATEDPQINMARVALRVSQGGHAVPADKIVQRYSRSIALLDAACNASNRAYVFDNSGDAHRLIAEITDGEVLTLHTDTLPAWFTATALWRSFQTA